MLTPPASAVMVTTFVPAPAVISRALRASEAGMRDPTPVMLHTGVLDREPFGLSAILTSCAVVTVMLVSALATKVAQQVRMRSSRFIVFS